MCGQKATPDTNKINGFSAGIVFYSMLNMAMGMDIHLFIDRIVKVSTGGMEI